VSRRAYTLEALADETGKSVSYWQELIRDNKIAAKRLGKTPLVLTSVYEAFLDSLPEA